MWCLKRPTVTSIVERVNLALWTWRKFQIWFNVCSTGAHLIPSHPIKSSFLLPSRFLRQSDRFLNKFLQLLSSFISWMNPSILGIWFDILVVWFIVFWIDTRTVTIAIAIWTPKQGSIILQFTWFLTSLRRKLRRRSSSSSIKTIYKCFTVFFCNFNIHFTTFIEF